MYELVTKVGATVVECGCVMDAKHQHNEVMVDVEIRLTLFGYRLGRMNYLCLP